MTPTKLRRFRRFLTRTATLSAIAGLSLAGAVALNITQTHDRNHHDDAVSELQATLDTLSLNQRTVKASTMTDLAEIGRLRLRVAEQGMELASTDGFIQ